MFEITAEWIVKRLETNNIISQDRSIYKYGLELFVSSLVGTLVIIIIGLIFNKLIEAFIYEFIFSMTRRSYGGYHCKSYIKCISLYSIMFVVSLAAKKLIIENTVLVFLIVIYYFIITCYCPVKNIYKPLSSSECKRHKRKAVLVNICISTVILLGQLLKFVISKYVFIVYTIIIILIILGELEYEKIKI